MEVHSKVIPETLTDNESHTRLYSIQSLLKKLSKGTLDIDAEYQRGEVWEDNKKTRLIQSILGNVTIPHIIINQTNNFRKLTVIDGKQRLSTCRDFYKNELDIEINDYERDESWLENPRDTLDKYYEKEGFKKVEDLKPFDCVFFKMRKVGPSSHVGIYLGNDLLLHQTGGVNGYSRIEDYTRWQKFTNYVIRHKDLK